MDKIKIGPAFSTPLPDFDFETYSEAGFVWDGKQFKSGQKNKKGLPLVGAAAYAEHPSTEVISVSYDLKDGLGPRLWVAGNPNPTELFNHIKNGGVLEAHNAQFEFFIWNFTCARMGWPPLSAAQLYCSAAKARAYNLPGSLAGGIDALGLEIKKNSDGAALIRKLSMPRKPTKTNPDLRLTPATAPEAFKQFYKYNIDDVIAETALSKAVPDLSPGERELWLVDAAINARGAYIDPVGLADCIKVYEYYSARLTEELQQLTQGAVKTGSEVAKMITWLSQFGVVTDSLDEESVNFLLSRSDIPALCRRVIEIRGALSSSSVKKLYSIKWRLNSDGRIRGLFQFCGADRTGRFAGRGPQPQNLPRGNLKVRQCDDINGCGNFYGHGLDACPYCATPATFSKDSKWNPEAADAALRSFHDRPAADISLIWDDPIATVAGCLRGLFTAAPGCDLICSDYSAIEGVVAAMLAREQWRIDVFRGHGKIYEMGASKITGVPFEEFLRHKSETGEHHPHRSTIGKVSELASGFGGWIGAWLNFGAGEFMTEPEIKDAILAWREASPNIVEMWGGQHRKTPGRWEFTPELFGLEGAAVSAILNPGASYSCNGITYALNPESGILYCRLLSGRFIHYHQARLEQHPAKNGMLEYQIFYVGSSGDDTYSKWQQNKTYGGKLFENVVQATARDIMTHAMVNVERAGYPIVLHVHDELVTERAHGKGSVEELEQIMGVMPGWAHDWPIKAAGGWRGLRFRKD